MSITGARFSLESDQVDARFKLNAAGRGKGVALAKVAKAKSADSSILIYVCDASVGGVKCEQLQETR